MQARSCKHLCSQVQKILVRSVCGIGGTEKDILIDFDHLRPEDFKISSEISMSSGKYRNRLSNSVFQSNFPNKPRKQKSLEQAEA